MIYERLADVVLVLHLMFVLFVIFGALLVLRWPRAIWVHIPAALWGAAVELGGWTCPLTPLEIWLLHLSGSAGYRGGFVGHYLLSWLYPEGLTRATQVRLGVAVLVINLAAYGWVWRRARKRRAGR